MSSEEVILLGSWKSPYAMKLRIALAEKGIQYEYKEENLKNKSGLLLKMNQQYKRVPVLIHNGKAICESLIGLQYIDETWKDGAPLLPSDPYLKAQAMFWGDFVDKKIYEVGKDMCLSEGQKQEAIKEEFINSLMLLENELGYKPYFGGETVGFVDLTLVPIYCLFHAFEVFCNLSIETISPKLSSWTKRCLERESVSKTLTDPNKYYEFLSKLKDKLRGYVLT